MQHADASCSQQETAVPNATTVIAMFRIQARTDLFGEEL